MTMKDIEALLRDGWAVESLCYDEDYDGYTASVSNPDGDVAIRGAKSVCAAIGKAVDTMRNRHDEVD